MTPERTHRRHREDLLADPDRLRQAWAELRRSQPHLHGPEAAALLGVPEGALLASRIGEGSVEVAPDLTTLLEPAADWGKLLVAGRSAFGVMLLVMDDVSVETQTDTVSLRTPTQCARLGTDGIARCHLFDDQDDHGHTVSLNWTDGDGDVVGRVFLMSKSGRRRALPWIHARRAQVQRQTWHPTWMLPPVLRQDHRRTCETLARAPGATRLAERCMLATRNVSSVRVELRSHGVELDYTGPFGKVWQTPPATHAADLRCKLHLRLGCTQRIGLVKDDMNMEAVRLEARDGSSLVLADAQSRPGEPWVRSWLDTVEAP